MRVETTICWSRGGHTCLSGPQCSGIQTCGYANGLHPANYPMPAIVLYVDDDYYLDQTWITVIWERRGPNDYRGAWSMIHD